mmetsp:Transcript_15996/g.45921  ORF Transcript_15996/g.45921 Transcript_15996/m.45921 type:complete len:268 (+) Transcript_15996:21-824(+)
MIVAYLGTFLDIICYCTNYFTFAFLKSHHGVDNQAFLTTRTLHVVQTPSHSLPGRAVLQASLKHAAHHQAFCNGCVLAAQVSDGRDIVQCDSTIYNHGCILPDTHQASINGQVISLDARASYYVDLTSNASLVGVDCEEFEPTHHHGVSEDRHATTVDVDRRRCGLTISVGNTSRLDCCHLPVNLSFATLDNHLITDDSCSAATQIGVAHNSHASTEEGFAGDGKRCRGNGPTSHIDSRIGSSPCSSSTGLNSKHVAIDVGLLGLDR